MVTKLEKLPSRLNNRNLTDYAGTATGLKVVLKFSQAGIDFLMAYAGFKHSKGFKRMLSLRNILTVWQHFSLIK